MKYWIKERNNPQLGIGIYYIACGQLPDGAVKREESTRWGSNIMIGFSSKKAYEARITELKSQGKRVQ